MQKRTHKLVSKQPLAEYLDADVTVPKTINLESLYAITLWPAVHGFSANSGYLQENYLFRPKDNFLIQCVNSPEILTGLYADLKDWLIGEKIPQYNPDELDGVKKMIAKEIPPERSQRIISLFNTFERKRIEKEKAQIEFYASLDEANDLFYPKPIAILIKQSNSGYEASPYKSDDLVIAKGKTAGEVGLKLGVLDENMRRIESFPLKYHLLGISEGIKKTLGRLFECSEWYSIWMKLQELYKISDEAQSAYKNAFDEMCEINEEANELRIKIDEYDPESDESGGCRFGVSGVDSKTNKSSGLFT